MSRPILDDWITEKINTDYSGYGAADDRQLPCGKSKNRRLQRKDLERYQLERINRTFALAAEKSPFYRTRFETVKLGSLEEMADLPFTTPEDLKADPYRMLCVHPDEISRIVTLKQAAAQEPLKECSLPNRTWSCVRIISIMECAIL